VPAEVKVRENEGGGGGAGVLGDDELLPVLQGREQVR